MLPDNDFSSSSVSPTTLSQPMNTSVPQTSLNTPISQTPQANVLPSSAPNTQQKQIGKYLVKVIREKCISAGSCVAIAPGVFALDEEQIAIIISQDGDEDDIKLLAAQSCPTAAIIVIDTETNTQVWPPIFEEDAA